MLENPMFARWARYPPSVSRKHQGLQRKDQRLQANDQGVHQCDRVNDVKEQPPPGADVLVGKQIVIVGIGIGDAQAAGWDTRKTSLIQRLEKDGERSRSRRLRST